MREALAAFVAVLALAVVGCARPADKLVGHYTGKVTITQKGIGPSLSCALKRRRRSERVFEI